MSHEESVAIFAQATVSNGGSSMDRPFPGDHGVERTRVGLGLQTHITPEARPQGGGRTCKMDNDSDEYHFTEQGQEDHPRNRRRRRCHICGHKPGFIRVCVFCNGRVGPCCTDFFINEEQVVCILCRWQLSGSMFTSRLRQVDGVGSLLRVARWHGWYRAGCLLRLLSQHWWG